MCAYACGSQVKLLGINVVMFAMKNTPDGVKNRPDVAGERLANVKTGQGTLPKVNRRESKGGNIVQRIGSHGASSSSLFSTLRRARRVVQGQYSDLRKNG